MKNNHEENQPGQIIVTQKCERATAVLTASDTKNYYEALIITLEDKESNHQTRRQLTNRPVHPGKLDLCQKAL